MLSTFTFKMKLFFKRLFCKHEYEYKGEYNYQYTHTCSKCLKTVVVHKSDME